MRYRRRERLCVRQSVGCERATPLPSLTWRLPCSKQDGELYQAQRDEQVQLPPGQFSEPEDVPSLVNLYKPSSRFRPTRINPIASTPYPAISRHNIPTISTPGCCRVAYEPAAMITVAIRRFLTWANISSIPPSSRSFVFRSRSIVFSGCRMSDIAHMLFQPATSACER